MELIGTISCCEIGNIPTDFIVDNIRYQKQIDGYYHMFIVGSPCMPQSSIGSISIPEAKELYHSIKYKKTIVYCTNNVKSSGGTGKTIFTFSEFVDKFQTKLKHILNEIIGKT